jgi:hypothetical protein
MFWTPTIGHWFPGITPSRINELTVLQLADCFAWLDKQ